MTIPKRPSRPTARQKLEESQLTSIAAKGLQGIQDVSLDKVRLQLRDGVAVEAVESITDIVLERTIEGASTLTVSLLDPTGDLLRSDRLTRQTDIQIDGIWFRLAALKRNSRTDLDLVFEDREVRVLRTYATRLGPVSRTKITRAEFIQRMADEVKELKIRTFIPQLHDIQPIVATKDLLSMALGQQQGINKRAGFPTAQSAHRHGEKIGLTVKSAAADNMQIKNINRVIQVGQSQGARRKVIVCAIMTIITESSARNLTGGDLDSVGLFQQRRSQGWPASRDIGKDASAFYSRAIGRDRTYPNLPYWQLCADVQHPREDLRTRYGDWRVEAERFVTEYGITGGAIETTSTGTTNLGNLAGTGAYFFYRGVPPSSAHGQWLKENSWDCGTRLASEVEWRSFMSGGMWYFVTEDYLFKTAPVMEIDDETDGIIDITFDFDEGKLNASVSIQAFMSRWAAPPGTIVKLKNLGPVDGNYLVITARRSLYSEQGDITLKKPAVTLLEPATGNLSNKNQVFDQTQNASQKITIGSVVFAGGFLPLTQKYVEQRKDQGRDFETDPGGIIIAPGDGEVVRIGVDPKGFGTAYPIVKFDNGPWAGETMYIGHTKARVSYGQKFKAGTTLSVTATTGQESWNGNATKPGWVELGFAPGGVPGPFGQKVPF